jgi:DNA-binding LytR/AlgR family response regulator
MHAACVAIHREVAQMTDSKTQQDQRAEQATFLLNTPLREIQDGLDPASFWRIHRSIIVNVGAVDTIYRSFRGGLELKLKDRSEILPVSKAYAHLFKHT